jgi:hypothetical protein
MSDSPRILGVDPGVTGGLALLFGATIEAHDIPNVAGEINIDEIIRIVRAAQPDFAIIEQASARPGQGVSSTFKYGQAYGMLRAVVGMCAIPSHLVTPSKWKRHFALDADKEKSRALAIRLWPGCGFFNRKKDHGRAEAALLARYGLEVVLRQSVLSNQSPQAESGSV